MALPASCVRCSPPLPAGSGDGICPACLIAHDTTHVSVVAFSSDDAPGGRGATAVLRVAAAGRRAALPSAPAGYELERRLGGGGMGEVYLAREPATERLVAMKFLKSRGNPAAVDRFLAEVRALARLDHPHIVRIIATDFHRADPFFTMDYAPGGTLAERVMAHGPLAPREAARVMAAVARAVHAAHAARVLHRDLKPSNILTAADGTPRVSDFGLAKRTDRDDGLTLTGPLGTPGFMPPEQVSARHGPVGPWSDVYGLGATLYYLITGRPPFVGDTPAEVVTLVETSPPERPRVVRGDIPMGVEAVVVRCLEKIPADRFPSAAALADELEKCAAGQPTETPPLTRWRRVRRWADRNRRHLVLAAGVGLVALAGWLALRPGDPIEAVERELDAGKTATLVGAKGEPRWHRWAVGTGELAKSETGDGTVAVQTHGVAFLELARDPRHNRFRLSAELRHLNGGENDCSAGLYAGFETVVSATGATAHPAVVVGFSEVFSLAEVADPASRARHRAHLSLVVPTRLPDQIAGRGRTTEFGSAPFKPRETDPKPWRKLVLDVSPDGVEAFWAGSPDGDLKPFNRRVTPDNLAWNHQRLQSDLPKELGGPIGAVPPWNPRRPVGVWANDSVVSIRNVTITPVLEPAR